MPDAGPHPRTLFPRRHMQGSEPHPPESASGRARRLADDLVRFPASIFQFDPRIRDGWLTDRYFLRSIHTLRHAGRDPSVKMQVFSKSHGIVAGIYESVRMIETQLTLGYSPADLRVECLLEGDEVSPWETVMLIDGPYRAFAHLETTILGVLARRSLVATNVRRTIDAAGGKPVIFMAPRHDDWRVQTPDGYAALIGGTRSVSSDAGGAWWGARGVGTMPHALIAAFGGDVVEATLAFARYVRENEPDVAILSLVDYDNDVLGDSLAVARAMREHFGDGVLSGVRVDTSEKLIDRSLIGDEEYWGMETLTGVNPPLVQRLREVLDAEGFDYVGIVVSGGLNPAKIRRFERGSVPIAAYGVGSSLLGHNDGAHGLLNNFDFTADVVEVEGRPESKVGRRYRPNPRLCTVEMTMLQPAH
jgi:nicotinate phosphoribosyltransferase